MGKGDTGSGHHLVAVAGVSLDRCTRKRRRTRQKTVTAIDVVYAQKCQRRALGGFYREENLRFQTTRCLLNTNQLKKEN